MLTQSGLDQLGSRSSSAMKSPAGRLIGQQNVFLFVELESQLLTSSSGPCRLPYRQHISNVILSPPLKLPGTLRSDRLTANPVLASCVSHKAKNKLRAMTSTWQRVEALRRQDANCDVYFIVSFLTV